MRKLLCFSLLFVALVPAWGQTGTPHGINVTATASTTSGVTYDLYRCSGAGCSVFTQVTSALAAPAYLDPSSSLAVSTSYSYVMTAVKGANESAYSNVATVTSPATWPANPNPPTGCNAQIQ
jgi:hypothetical protein